MVQKTRSKSDGPEGGLPGPYVVLARKYRPATFDDLIGQQAMITTLRNAFASGRIAQGYMLTGVRGVGKTTTARILARALNYETDEIAKPKIDMPGLGKHCGAIMEGRHPDVLEMDAASNTGVDNIREIIESAQYTPLVARNKVFIIDEVHMLSKGAFNALLKTLEEPPAHVKFIFATTEIRKVPVTVLSRCQRFDLRRVELPVLVAHFKKIAAAENAKADDDALALIARAAEGSVRDGLSILDQAIAMGQGQGRVEAGVVRAMLGLADRARIFDLAEALFRGDAAAAVQGLTALHQDGAEAGQIVSSLAEAIHIVARVKAAGEEPAGEGLSREEKARAKSLADRLPMPYLTRAWQMLLKGLDEINRAPNPLAAAEMTVIRVAYTADLPSPDEVIKSLAGHAVPAPGKLRPAPAAAEISAHQTVNKSLSAPAAHDAGPETDDFGSDFERADFDEPGVSADVVPDLETVPISSRTEVRSFDDAVALVGEKRDAKLKIHLEDHVSLVKFDASSGAIDLFLLPGAPPELANELREKLNNWTNRRWVVVLSKAPGAEAIGAVRRRREAEELERLKALPLVQAVLNVFPGAKIVSVPAGPAAKPAKDGSATG